MRFDIAVFSLFVVCGAPLAQTSTQSIIKDRVQALAKEAFETRQTGDFKRAILLYRRAFEISPIPELLYNMAFIFETNLRDLSSARDLYGQCIKLPDIEESLKVKARQRLDVIRAKIIAEAQFRSEPSSLGYDEDVHRVKASIKHPAPVWIMTTGAVGFAAGLTVGAVALYNANRVGNITQLDDKKKTQSLAESQALAADIVLSASAAVALTGLIWFFVSDEESKATVSPTMGVGRMGLNWRTRF